MTTTMPPWQRHSSTSRDAALSVYHQRGPMAQKVYDTIRSHQPVTDERIADLTGMNPSTVRPRRVELLKAGLIRKAALKGRTRSGRAADQWETVPQEPEQGGLW